MVASRPCSISRLRRGDTLRAGRLAPRGKAARRSTCLFYCLVDRRVAGAAAEVAADRLGHLLACRHARRVQEGPRRHEHPGCAVAALRGTLFRERDLERIELRTLRETLDGRDLGV